MATAPPNSGQRQEGKKGQVEVVHRKDDVIATSNFNNVSVSVRNYELNKLKCIEKKLLAIKRPSFEVDQNEVGNCIVISFNTASYELFKLLLKDQYQGELNKGTVTLKEGRDTAANKVDFSLKVSKRNSKYTINLFNTTSRAMINGKNHKDFLKVFEKIAAQLSNLPVSELSNKLEMELQVAHKAHHADTMEDDHQLVTVQSIPDPLPETMTDCNKKDIGTSVRRSSRSRSVRKPYDPTGQADIGDTPVVGTGNEDQPPTPECVLCDNIVLATAMALECTECSMWIHAGCDNTLTPAIYQQHEEDPGLDYLCPMCEYDRIHSLITNNVPQHVNLAVDNVPQQQKSLAINNKPKQNSLGNKNVPQDKSLASVTVPQQISSEPARQTFIIQDQTNIPNNICSNTDPTTTVTDSTTTPATANQGQPIPQTTLDDIQTKLKELKKRERDLKKWENDIKREAKDLSEVIKELAGSRALIEKYEYEIAQLRYSKRIQQELVNKLESNRLTTPGNPPSYNCPQQRQPQISQANQATTETQYNIPQQHQPQNSQANQTTSETQTPGMSVHQHHPQAQQGDSLQQSQSTANPAPQQYHHLQGMTSAPLQSGIWQSQHHPTVMATGLPHQHQSSQANQATAATQIPDRPNHQHHPQAPHGGSLHHSQSNTNPAPQRYHPQGMTSTPLQPPMWQSQHHPTVTATGPPHPGIWQPHLLHPHLLHQPYPPYPHGYMNQMFNPMIYNWQVPPPQSSAYMPSMMPPQHVMDPRLLYHGNSFQNSLQMQHLKSEMETLKLQNELILSHMTQLQQLQTQHPQENLHGHRPSAYHKNPYYGNPRNDYPRYHNHHPRRVTPPNNSDTDHNVAEREKLTNPKIKVISSTYTVLQEDIPKDSPSAVVIEPREASDQNCDTCVTATPSASGTIRMKAKRSLDKTYATSTQSNPATHKLQITPTLPDKAPNRTPPEEEHFLAHTEMTTNRL